MYYNEEKKKEKVKEEDEKGFNLYRRLSQPSGRGLAATRPCSEPFVAFITTSAVLVPAGANQ